MKDRAPQPNNYNQLFCLLPYRFTLDRKVVLCSSGKQAETASHEVRGSNFGTKPSDLTVNECLLAHSADTIKIEGTDNSAVQILSLCRNLILDKRSSTYGPGGGHIRPVRSFYPVDPYITYIYLIKLGAIFLLASHF